MKADTNIEPTSGASQAGQSPAFPLAAGSDFLFMRYEMTDSYSRGAHMSVQLNVSDLLALMVGRAIRASRVTVTLSLRSRLSPRTSEELRRLENFNTRAMGQMEGRHQHGGDVGSTPSGSPNTAVSNAEPSTPPQPRSR